MIIIKEGKKGCHVQVAGKTSELLSELAYLIDTLLESEDINEEILDVAIGLGKAKAKGNTNEFMRTKLKEVMLKAFDKMAGDIEKEENED